MYKSLLALSFTAAIVAAPRVANALELNCTAGCNQVFSDAYWVTVDQQSTGTGVIQSFVRIQGNPSLVDGHNTSGRPLLNDENNSPQFTRDLQLKNIPILTIDPPGATPSTAYYEFLLDINQTGSEPLLSLDQVLICTGGSGGLTLADGCPTGTVAYNLDAGVNDNIKLNYSLNSGSGSGDLFLYVPVANFAGVNPNTFVYLYSVFGATTYPDNQNNQYGNNDGFEEWAVRVCASIPNATCTPNEELPPVVPEPASVMLLGTGLIGLAAAVRRRRRAV